MKKIQDIVFAITDTETTGKEQGVDKAIEIASVKWNLKEGFLEIPKSWFVKPDRPIHPSAMAIHHLTEDDIKDAPTLETVQPEVEAYVKDCVIIAHNAPFDQSMLPFLDSYPWLDSLRIARHIWKKGDLNVDGHDLTSHTCQELRYWLGLTKIDTMGLPAHRAAADIIVAGYVFGKSVEKYIELSGNDSYEDFAEFANAPVLVDKMTFGKYKGKPLTEVDTDYFSWYLNKIASGEMDANSDLLHSIDLTLRARGISSLDLIKIDNTNGQTNSWANIAQAKNTVSSKVFSK